MGATTQREAPSANSNGPDPFDEGCRAAAEGIPAEANPYPPGTDKNALWQDGHEAAAKSMESGQTEDS